MCIRKQQEAKFFANISRVNSKIVLQFASRDILLDLQNNKKYNKTNVSHNHLGFEDHTENASAQNSDLLKQLLSCMPMN